MTTIAKRATKAQYETWIDEAERLIDGADRARAAAYRHDERAVRAAVGYAQAAIERIFAALPERAT